MIALSTGVRVWVAAGHTDMRRGMQSLALRVQEGDGRLEKTGRITRTPASARVRVAGRVLCAREEPGSGQDSQESPEVGMVIRSSNGPCGTAAWSVNCQNDSTLNGAPNGCGSFDPIVK
jgi:hypothetical protein